MPILIVGDANADLSATIDRFPAAGGDALVGDLAWCGGGSATNVATALGRLGAPVRLLARVGRDPAAEIALRLARGAGVDLGAVQIDTARATGLCYAAVARGGERTFFSFRGANVALAPLDAAQLDDIDWLHVSAYALLEDPQRATTHALIEAAAARAIPISLDMCLPAVRDRRDELVDLLPRLSILFANEHELAELWPGLDQAAALDRLHGAGLPRAAIKRGARGALIATHDQRVQAPAFTVPAIDTNGCGDAFVAGFLIAQRRGAPLQQCGTLANALGALTATRRGAAEALPDRQELCAFLAAQPNGAHLVELLG